MPLTEQVRKKLSDLPHKPGIYLMKDRDGELCRQGVRFKTSRQPIFSSIAPTRLDVKFRALVDAIHDLDTHIVKSEPEALLLEGKLIKEFHPRY